MTPPGHPQAYTPRRSLVAGWPGKLVSVAVLAAVLVLTEQQPGPANLLISLLSS